MVNPLLMGIIWIIIHGKTLLRTIIPGWWTTLHPQDPACEVSKPSFLSLPKRCVWITLADRVRIPSDPWKKWPMMELGSPKFSKPLGYVLLALEIWDMLRHRTFQKSTLGIITSWNSLFIFGCFVSHFISEGFLGSESWIVLTVGINVDDGVDL